MRARILTAAIGLPALALVLCFFDTAVINTAMAILAAISVYEIAGAVNCRRPAGPMVCCMIFAALVQFFPLTGRMDLLPLLVLLLMVLVFWTVVTKFEQIKMGDLGLMLAMTLGVTFSFFTFVLMRDHSPSFAIGIYYALIMLGSAWWADGGAYFIGRAFGKHKLAPLVSPKKSVEGLFGGIATGILGNLLVTAIFCALHNSGRLGAYSGVDFRINYGYLVILSFVLVLLGVLGDLSASAVKRQYGIKDFGTIFPGHGGIMDRFDSLLFITPLAYLVMRLWPFLTLE